MQLMLMLGRLPAPRAATRLWLFDRRPSLMHPEPVLAPVEDERDDQILLVGEVADEAGQELVGDEGYSGRRKRASRRAPTPQGTRSPRRRGARSARGGCRDRAPAPRSRARDAARRRETAGNSSDPRPDDAPRVATGRIAGAA